MTSTRETCPACKTAHDATPQPGRAETWRCRNCAVYIHTVYDKDGGIVSVDPATDVQVLLLELADRKRAYENLQLWYDSLKPPIPRHEHPAYPRPLPSEAHQGFILSQARKTLLDLEEKYKPARVNCIVAWDLNGESWAADTSVWIDGREKPFRMVFIRFASVLGVVAAVENWLATDPDLRLFLK